MNSRKHNIIWLALLLPALLFAANLFIGSVKIPFGAVLDILTGGTGQKASWTSIVLQSRLPQAITALLAGAALAISGLMLQTLFRNPLAGPSILGISDGANLGVAIAIMALGGTFGAISGLALSGYLLIVLSAFAGALLILSVIIWFSTKVTSNVMLLIIGIMVGYLASSAISILNFYATADKVHAYAMWGLGNFSAVSLDQLPFFCSFVIAGLAVAMMLIKPLNALLLGEAYAENLGVNIKRTRAVILICTGILTATVTAFCGPVSFIGLVVPHIARLLLGSSNHNRLVPVTILMGSTVALLCNLITVLPGSNMLLPLNAVTPILGAPVIIYVIVNKKNIQYFN